MTGDATPVPRSEVVSSSHVMTALLGGIDQLGDGVFLLESAPVKATEWTLAYVNDAFCSALGRPSSELLDRPFSEVFPTLGPDLEPPPAEGSAPLRTDVGVVSAAGESLSFELSLHPVREAGDGTRSAMGVLRNVTGERERDLLRLERERLASVELLAAGMAHEVNNPLASITTNLEWLVMQLPGLVSPSPNATAEIQAGISAALVDALVGAERIEATIRYLSMLSGLEDARRELLDVRALLEAAVTELEAQLGTATTIVRQYAEVPPVMASEQRLKQAFVNLILNAMQAIGPSSQRRLITLRVHGSARVRVEVQDSGPGVPDEVRARLFTPFVTTKPPGLGKGLGLFLCRRILEAAGGSVGFRSRKGQGATFWVELPAATS